MAIICPTVTAFDTAAFQAQLALVSNLADRLHIDLMDGDFAPTISPALADLTLPTGKIIDIHVMYRDPARIISELIKAKPHLVIIHAESDADVPLFATHMREHGIKTGLALLPETPVESVVSLLPHVQHLLVFGGRLGYHGGEADLAQAEKVAQAKTYARHLEYGWDGGANISNVAQLANAGINVINVGSGIHAADDPKAMYQILQKTA